MSDIDEYTERLQQLIAATQQHLATYQQRQQGIPVSPELYRETVLAVEDAYQRFWLWPVD